MKKRILFGFTLMTFAFAGPALAHYPWINLSDYTPEPGSACHATLGWGHGYPFAGFLKKEAVDRIEVKGPGTLGMTHVSELELTSDSISVPGTYVIGMVRKPGFYTKTAAGGKQASKEKLKHVIRCSYSHMSAKAVVNAGQGKGKADAAMNHAMEIIPLKNPADLRQGDYLPLRVLYKGAPFKGQIFATYAGFSTEKSVFAYTAETDKRGEGKIRILTPGIWMVKAGHEEPYPDPEVCDVSSYVASLTFEVK